MEEKGKPPYLVGYKEGPHSLISGKYYVNIMQCQVNSADRKVLPKDIYSDSE